jgi:hypothetical protein
METFQITVVHAWPPIHTKNKTHSLLDGRRTPQVNGGMHASPRCDPGEHVLPIIQRLRWYAQLATRLANPRRFRVIKLYPRYLELYVLGYYPHIIVVY